MKIKFFYTEVRYGPQLMRTDFIKKEDVLTSAQVVEAVNAGLERGMKEFGVVVKVILCVLRHFPPDWGFEVVELAKKYQSAGVVAVDLAGDEVGHPNEKFTKVFDKAKELGLNITIHAGEAAGYQSVDSALAKLHAQRIGHGYNCLKNETTWKNVLSRRICLECCPISSYITASVPDKWSEHPLHQFIKAKANWTLSSDDPGVFGHDYCVEIRDAKKNFSLTDSDIGEMQLRAMESSFCPEPEKTKLIKSLRLALIQKGVLKEKETST